MKIPVHLLKSHPLTIGQKTPPSKQSVATQQDHFKQILQGNLVQGDLTISKHAEKRMKERNIVLSVEQQQQLLSKMKEAKQLGVNDSLVLTNEAAFVVSVKNKTIITALSRHEASSQIFTNINGTIIL